MVTAAIPILSSKRWRTDSKFQYRSHGDRFIYDMRVPQAFAARHRTHSVSGGLSALLKISESAQWRMGAEGGLDTIGSNSLGHHSVSRSAGYGELEWKISRLLTLTPGFRFDEYQVYGSAFSPAVSGSYWLLPTLRWRSTLGRAFRVPSFTERFYRDPNHQATSHLRPERAVAAETGIDWFAAKNVLLHGVIFRRWETDVIDWVRSNENQPWTTTNIHSLRTSGFESGIELWQGPVQARASYGYLQTHADLASLLSKYVLDYPKHSVTLNFTSELRAGWRLGLTGNYRSPTNRSDYWLLGCRLERRWGDRVVFVDGSNLLNTWYEEIRGIRMPGRWIRVGFEFDPFAF
jgi:iron complex outermembrane receptor protein